MPSIFSLSTRFLGQPRLTKAYVPFEMVSAEDSGSNEEADKAIFFSVGRSRRFKTGSIVADAGRIQSKPLDQIEDFPFRERPLGPNLASLAKNLAQLDSEWFAWNGQLLARRAEMSQRIERH